MTNNEVLKNYGTEEWVVRETLSYLLMEYAEKLGVKNPFNPVTFVIEFLEKETYVYTELAEKSKMDSVNKAVIIDVDGKEM